MTPKKGKKYRTRCLHNGTRGKTNQPPQRMVLKMHHLFECVLPGVFVDMYVGLWKTCL